MRLRTVRQVKQQQQHQKRRKMEILSSRKSFNCNLIQFSLIFFILFILAFLDDDEPATKSFVQLSALEAESIVEYFIATMYGGGHETIMNGNMIEASLIPGSTGISPSPTMQHDLYHNGNILSANAVTSLRTHSSKFPVSF